MIFDKEYELFDYMMLNPAPVFGEKNFGEIRINRDTF